MKNNYKKDKNVYTQMSIIESVCVSIIGIVFFGSVIFADPSGTPAGNNVSIPINASATAQSKKGTTPTYTVNDMVPRALGVGYSNLVGNNITLGVAGRLRIGSLSTTADGMNVTGNARDMDKTVINPTDPASPSDGSVKVTGLGGAVPGPSGASLCIQADSISKKLIRC
jgi:hypothetical protein